MPGGTLNRISPLEGSISSLRSSTYTLQPGKYEVYTTSVSGFTAFEVNVYLSGDSESPVIWVSLSVGSIFLATLVLCQGSQRVEKEFPRDDVPSVNSFLIRYYQR